ncbi:MAG TPA: 1-(5-phosphoribosyl)-5-[(5-phosphoribosylamino)methylideneamino] imidazole-4-carboxamide isomerase [Thermoanaerobaculia bacterium]|nr:1-(5-phosphoribosyl)-5-[(5-phosphoribosylamino)methylideneamino] imidazole-4-carboxamide isomerase [Thermoanaerobaculia bacterium]
MDLLPAIDLRSGRVVRLVRGDDAQRRTYDVDPLAALLGYAEAGVERVHVVDLDAAFGESPQRGLVARLAAHPGAPRIELGGGLRDREAVEWAFAAGVERVVVTSMLVRDFELFADLARAHPRSMVAALDLEAGVLRHSGWTASAARSTAEVCRDLRALPLAAVLVTDIARDGTMEGPNLDLARDLSRLADAPAILSGGVRSLEDLAQARAVPEIAAAVVGRALYDGALDLRRALAVCRGEAGVFTRGPWCRTAPQNPSPSSTGDGLPSTTGRGRE